MATRAVQPPSEISRVTGTVVQGILVSLRGMPGGQPGRESGRDSSPALALRLGPGAPRLSLPP